MPRIARKDIKMPYNHVIVQGINKEFIFKSNLLKEKYVKLIKQNLKTRLMVNLIAYCMMGNHAHMLFYTEDIIEISKLMHSVNTSYAQYYNRSKNRVGVVFRNRYYLQPIYSEKQLYNCIVYIHNNPVKANIVKTPDEYQYSSYKEWINDAGIINNQIVQLIHGEKIQNKEEFQKMHQNDDILDIKDIADVVDYNAIIKEYENKTQKTVSELVKNEEILEKLVMRLKIDSRLSIRQISEILKTNRPKITKIIKNM